MKKLLAAALLAAALCLPASAGAAPKRIVALTPFGANTLVKLGVTPVGIGQTLGGQDRFSPKLKKVEVLPLSHPNGPNLEQLASLDPDLVLSTPTWAKGNESMGDLGIRVLIREPRDVNGAYSQTLAIGNLVGKHKQAEALVESMKKSVAQARKGIEEHPTVMVILGVGRTPFTFLPNSWGGDLVSKAGGELLTAGVESSSSFERISDEVVVAEDPDVIIAVPHANEDDIPSLTEYLRTEPGEPRSEGGDPSLVMGGGEALCDLTFLTDADLMGLAGPVDSRGPRCCHASSSVDCCRSRSRPRSRCACS